MKNVNPATFVLLAMILPLGLATGCHHPESVELGKGKEIRYEYNTDDIDQIKMTAPAASADPDQEGWLKRYYEDKKKPASVPKVISKPMAATEDIETVAARITFLKGTVKKAVNGAITGITVSSSGDDPKSSITTEDMQAIGRLYDLETISFEGDSFDDAKIAALSNLKKLKSVVINNSGIQTATLELLAQLPELKTLEIRRDLKLDNSSLAALAAYPKLERLYAHYNAFTNSGMAKISKVASLKVVDVRGCTDVSDNGAKYLARLPELQEVHFRGMITNAGVEHLTNAPKLKYVEFQDCNEIDAGSVASFLKMPSLRELRLFRCKSFTDEALKGIASIPFVRLELRDLNLSNEGLASLAGKETLKALEISELPGVDQTGLADFLQTLSGLEELTLFAMPMGLDTLIAIEDRMPDIKRLTLRAGALTDDVIDSILQLKKLEELDLRENDQMTPEYLLHLGELKSLKVLHLSGTSLSRPENADSLKKLRKALPKCRISG
ncbi:MAG: hypothetical protein Q4G68_02035 [Planctomycetia bacterium]|nr:hypothetical protein [Planctomycetia bacterium]